MLPSFSSTRLHSWISYFPAPFTTRNGHTTMFWPAGYEQPWHCVSVLDHLLQQNLLPLFPSSSLSSFPWPVDSFQGASLSTRKQKQQSRRNLNFWLILKRTATYVPWTAYIPTSRMFLEILVWATVYLFFCCLAYLVH